MTRRKLAGWARSCVASSPLEDDARRRRRAGASGRVGGRTPVGRASRRRRVVLTIVVSHEYTQMTFSGPVLNRIVIPPSYSDSYDCANPSANSASPTTWRAGRRFSPVHPHPHPGACRSNGEERPVASPAITSRYRCELPPASSFLRRLHRCGFEQRPGLVSSKVKFTVLHPIANRY